MSHCNELLRCDARGHCAEVSKRGTPGRVRHHRHYLTHTAEIDAYLAKRQAEAAELQRAIETRFNPVGIRARLLARQRRTR